MAFNIRSAADISKSLRGSMRQYLKGTDSALKDNLNTIIIKVVALLAHEFELRMGFLSKQLFLTTATKEAWIKLHCAEVGVYQKPAAASTGAVTGTGAASTTYPEGIRFLSGNVIYVSSGPATSDGSGNLTLTVVSEVKGAFANRDSGGLLVLADPGVYPTLDSEWEVGTAGLGGGADVEDMESLRARGLQRKRNPPGGGTLTDYERIVTDVPGVIKAWAFRAVNAPGMIVVHFLFADRNNNIPEAGDVAVVQAAVDKKRLIRVDDSVAVAPIAHPVDVEIDGLSQDTAEIRAAIEAAIAAMYIARCRPSVTGNLFTVSLSWYGEAISTVTGEDRHTLVAPSADITVPSGHFPVNGTFVYGA